MVTIGSSPIGFGAANNELSKSDDFLFAVVTIVKIYFENFDSCIDDQSPFSAIVMEKVNFISLGFFHLEVDD